MNACLREIVAWNTGCLYSTKGQRIAACLMSDRTVCFYDIDRGVYGTLNEKFEKEALLNENWVLTRYLKNEHDGWIDDASVKELLHGCAERA